MFSPDTVVNKLELFLVILCISWSVSHPGSSDLCGQLWLGWGCVVQDGLAHFPCSWLTSSRDGGDVTIDWSWLVYVVVVIPQHHQEQQEV